MGPFRGFSVLILALRIVLRLEELAREKVQVCKKPSKCLEILPLAL
jgi:hypothetical protein